jgi:alkanesulfonate monooxygenase SsuD/methylene tetrahydromethanopterin reductase-like flavin-dependent oxidoreductase (luciferase family)
MMEVGLQFIFQNTHEGMSDAEMMRKETEIALLAEDVGMDFLLRPEHHFDPNYAIMPDNMQCHLALARKPDTRRRKGLDAAGASGRSLPAWLRSGVGA